MAERTGRTEYVYNVYSDKCISRKLLNVVTRRWSLLILASLQGAPQHFNELSTHIQGISQRMLSITLKELTQDCLVEKIPESAGQLYALTESGANIAMKIDELFEAMYSSLDHMDKQGLKALDTDN